MTKPCRRSASRHTLFMALRRRLGRWLRRADDRSDRGPAPEVMAAWRCDRGDEILRFQYPLDTESPVLDVGGYRGQWSSDLFAMYRCTVHDFEPVPDFAQFIRSRFARTPRIRVHEFGLGARTTRVSFHKDQDRSSAATGRGCRLSVTLRSAKDSLDDEDIAAVDLMKINIEAGEFEPLEHLIDRGAILRIRNLLVQFHRFVPNADGRRLKLRGRLDATHCLTWDYPFVWEKWRLRDLDPLS